MVQQATTERQEGTTVQPPDKVGTTFTGDQPAAPAEPDWKIEHAKLSEENKALLQKLRSAEGRLKTREPDASGEILAEIKRMRREERRERIEASEIEPAEKSKRLQEIQQEEQQDTESSSFRKYATRIAEKINRRLTRAGVDYENPKVAEALTRWRNARSQDDIDDIYETLDDFLEEATEDKHKKDVEAARIKAQEEFQRKNRDQGLLEQGTPSGRGAGVTIDSDNIDAEYNKGRVSEGTYRHFRRTGEIDLTLK